MQRFGGALSTERKLSAAIGECVDKAVPPLRGTAPDLAIVFASPEHADPDLAAILRRRTGARCLIGCLSESIVGERREVESGPALSLLLASLPGALLEPFHLEVERTPDGIAILGMPALGGATEPAPSQRSLLLFADPHSFPADHWLQRMNEDYPGLPVLGGMCTPGRGTGPQQLLLQDSVFTGGAVGLVLDGVKLRAIVSQGCRPIGRPAVITRAHRNVIDELAGRPALQFLQEAFESSAEADKQLIQRAAATGGLHIGQVVDERISKPRRGDFLVRSVMSADNDSGAVMINDYARVGRTVCFHVRDAESATEDLTDLLKGAEPRAGAALLFTCNGRGTHMFAAPDHDVGCLERRFGKIPVAGFFAAGEIGPVGGANFLHGFTASVGLFAGES